MITFHMKESKIMNLIIKNFYAQSYASMNARVNEIKKKNISQFKDVIGAKDYRANKAILERVAEELARDAEAKYKKRNKKYPNDKIVNIRIQKDIANIKEIEEGFEAFKGNRAAYFKMLFEEYARKPQFERTKIVYGKQFNEIMNCINPKEHSYKEVVIKYTESQFPCETIAIPCKITSRTETSFPIVFFLQKNNDENQPFIVQEIALSKIKEISINRTLQDSLITAEIIKISKNLSETNNASFQNNDKRIVVSFSEQGLYKMFNTPLRRPFFDEKRIRENGSMRYIVNFEGKISEAKEYLSQFGADALVIEPKSLQEDFHKLFNDASNAYSAPEKARNYIATADVLSDIQSHTNNFEETCNDMYIKYMNKAIAFEDTGDVLAFTIGSVEAGLTDWAPYVADFYFDGEIIEQDYSKAAHYYLMAFDRLNRRQYLNLASLFDNNLLLEPVSEKQINILKEATRDASQYNTCEGYSFYYQAFNRVPDEYNKVVDNGDEILAYY